MRACVRVCVTCNGLMSHSFQPPSWHTSYNICAPPRGFSFFSVFCSLRREVCFVQSLPVLVRRGPDFVCVCVCVCVCVHMYIYAHIHNIMYNLCGLIREKFHCIIFGIDSRNNLRKSVSPDRHVINQSKIILPASQNL